MGHADHHRHEGEEQCRQKSGSISSEPSGDAENDEHAKNAPGGRVAARDEVELAEFVGVIQVMGYVGADIDEAERAAEADECADGVYEQAAVLVEARVEIEAARFHAREGHHGDHLVGLVGVESIAEVNAGDVFFGGGEGDGFTSAL